MLNCTIVEDVGTMPAGSASLTTGVNNLMLADNYKSLFYFPTFKEFIGSVTSETNWFNVVEPFFLDLQFCHILYYQLTQI